MADANPVHAPVARDEDVSATPDKPKRKPRKPAPETDAEPRGSAELTSFGTRRGEPYPVLRAPRADRGETEPQSTGIKRVDH